MPWVRCTKALRCPICDKPDWCEVTEDGQIALCMRIESDKPVVKGGWTHKLSDPIPVRKARPAKPPEPPPDFTAERDRCKMGVDHPKLYQLGVKLGLPAEALSAMEVGWDGKNYTFPMYDGNCECIGVRLRSENGRKFAIEGSKNGLFIPVIGVYPDSPQTLFVVEGPTDCAAMVAMGLTAIGRPSCQGGTEDIKQFIRGHRRDVVIVADRDPPKKRPDGTVWRPGVDGAYRLAISIRQHTRNVKVIVPPKYKDVRAWYHAGGTGNAILALAKNTKWMT